MRALTLPNGIALTSGTAKLPLTNTANQFNPGFPGTGGRRPPPQSDQAPGEWCGWRCALARGAISAQSCC